jgi:diguanylate cyclase (GGDEF)-like protein
MRALKSQSSKTVDGTLPFGEGLQARLDSFAVARNLSTPVWIFDVDHSRILFANEAACTLWQAVNEEDLRSRDMSEGMSTTVSKRLKQYQADFELRKTTFREMWTLYPAGKPVSSSVAYTGFRLTDGRMAMQCEALTLANDEPDNLRSAEALLHTDVMIALFELEGTNLYMNPAARNTMCLGVDCLSTFFSSSTDYHVMMFELDEKGEHHMVAKVKTNSDERWFDISAKNCSDAVTGKPAVLITAIDVSELKTARDKARYLADRDQLTGCFNRAFLERHVSSLARGHGPQQCLLYIDVDRFKHVNDTFGHQAGDDVLKELSLRAQNAVGRNGLVSRLGGDEFVILLECGVAHDDTFQKVDAVFEELSGTILSGSTNLQIHISMGMTEFDPSETDFENALRQADIALYNSKREGRNRITLYDAELGNTALEKSKFEVEIREGLLQRQFVLYYQPRLDIASRNIVSMEGLVRWNHPERGIVGPNSFIPICEETGMIEELGKQVLEMGFEQALRWQDSGQDMHLSLNISPRQFADDGLMALLTDFALKPGAPTEKIELEITENVLIGDLDVIISKLKSISKLGYKISIDDFGTGYSNLSYISSFPLSCLKIDQSFIQQLPKSGPIVRLILTLGKQIDAIIVAEGVETQEQFDWLVNNNCDQIQGYFISRPAPLDQLANVHTPIVE